MDLQLSGKTVFITGASGGIGRELARAFAAEGANLALHANTGMAWLGEFIEKSGWAARAIAVQADVSDPAAVEAAMQAAVNRFGSVDVCVANAGKWPVQDLLLHEIPQPRLQDTLATNLYGAIWTARAFLRQVRPRADGHGASLCFIGSTAGRFGEPMHADYAISKAGLYGLVRSLKTEIARLDPFGRVNMVEPGWTVTEMAREALDKPGNIERITRTMPLRQLARARDIASVVAALSSPAISRHVSGEVITVAGGMDGRTLWQASDIDEAAIRARVRDQQA